MARFLLSLFFCSMTACEMSEETTEEPSSLPAHFSDLEPLKHEHVAPNETRVRLTLSPSFLSPIVYDLRLNTNDNSGQLRVRRYSGKGGYDPGAVELVYFRELTESETGVFLAHLEESMFWELPPEELVKDTTGESNELVPYAGLDGDTYTLQAKSGDRFHSVWRWQALQVRINSEETSDIAAFSSQILEAAGISPINRDFPN
ncbi:MAG: hypothetical protein AAGI48_14220 [Verrucomicrobiota bacterium]